MNNPRFLGSGSDDVDPHVARYRPFVPHELREPPVPARTDWFDLDYGPGGTVLHLYRHPSPVDPPRARIVILHGAGGHGRMLASLGVAAQQLGCSAVAPDLPGYGHTEVADPAAVTYPDWVRAGIAVAEAESASGGPVIVVGGSMGGRLGLDVAHATPGTVNAVIATCLLDPRLAGVRRAVTRHPLLGAVSRPALRALPRRIDGVRVPIRWIAPLGKIANNPELANAVLTDPLGGGRRIPLGFLRSWLEHDPGYEPETFGACPVTLVHPEHDRWTPLALSQAWFERLSVERHLVLLGNCGHFPVEEPGIHQLRTALADVVDAAEGPSSTTDRAATDHAAPTEAVAGREI